MRRSGIARRTGPRASPAPQGIPLAKFRLSVDMSTVVRSKRTSKCRDVLFETNIIAPTWPFMAIEGRFWPFSLLPINCGKSCSCTCVNDRFGRARARPPRTLSLHFCLAVHVKSCSIFWGGRYPWISLEDLVSQCAHVWTRPENSVSEYHYIRPYLFGGQNNEDDKNNTSINCAIINAL